MSREQGPREAGMRPAANVAGRRRGSIRGFTGLAEAAPMSREQGPRAQRVKRGGASASREPGPREAGMRPAASHSRPPKRTLFGNAGLLRSGAIWRHGTPVATVANAAGHRQEGAWVLSGFNVAGRRHRGVQSSSKTIGGGG